MSYTLIDSDDYAASGIETMFFPGGEPHAKVPKFKGDVLFVARCRTWADTGIAALVANALSRQGLTKLEVFLPYSPGARQDRSDGSSGFTADIVGLMFGGNYQLHTFDLHSRAAAEAMMWPHQWDLCALQIPKRHDVVCIIAPDKGAYSRALAFRDCFYPGTKLIQCVKNRNAQTGQLSNYVLPPIAERGRYIVVDDICDGGGTFNLLAQAWAVQPIRDSKLELVVSHGIFSKGLSAISSYYEHITTTDSWCNAQYDYSVDPRLTVLPLAPLYDKIMGETK